MSVEQDQEDLLVVQIAGITERKKAVFKRGVDLKQVKKKDEAGESERGSGRTAKERRPVEGRWIVMSLLAKLR